MYHVYTNIYGEQTSEKEWALNGDSSISSKYATDLLAYNFLTCNSANHPVNNAMFADYFDLYVLFSLLLCAMTIVCTVYGYHKKSLGSSIESSILLIFFPPLLNVYVEPDQWVRKTFFMRSILFVWILCSFFINSMYQNIVISDFTKPLDAVSPWSGIYSLKGFTIFSSLMEHASSVQFVIDNGIKNNSQFYYITYRSKSGKNTAHIFMNDSLLYNASFVSAVAWFYTGLGYSMWSLFEPVCPTWSNEVRRENSIDSCVEKGKLIFDMEPFQSKNTAEIYANLSRCEEKNALVETADTITAIQSRLNVRGQRKKFWSGDINMLQIEQPVFWVFEMVPNENDVHLRRLQSLIESGLYAYLKKIMNPINEEVLTKLEQKVKNRGEYENIAVQPLTLESNVVSIFYIYGACNIAIIIFWLVSKTLVGLIGYASEMTAHFLSN